MSAARPILCLVTDRRSARRPLAAAVEAAVAGGVDWVQVREKDLEGGALAALVDALAAAAARGRARAPRAAGDAAADGRPPVRILVNRRVDVALAAGADGVHLGFDAVCAGDARRLVGASRQVGVSCHDGAELRACAAAGADYAHLAPIFAPRSKPATRLPLGPEALERAAGCGVPVLAQGGVSAANTPALVAAGAAGVAVTGGILMASDPAAAAAALRRALDG